MFFGQYETALHVGERSSLAMRCLWENIMGLRRWTFVEEAVPARVAWAGQFTLGLLATLCIVASAMIIYLR